MRRRQVCWSLSAYFPCFANAGAATIRRDLLFRLCTGFTVQYTDRSRAFAIVSRRVRASEPATRVPSGRNADIRDVEKYVDARNLIRVCQASSARGEGSAGARREGR
ncbi:hypothetical protein EXIGLDRAFT_731339 [Exidia glandulosa HHB12029]|uniref:Uncharacterized protein n=1 Tax=Exidia glandulosa HHB12029 TaxID=1314781 RepID=A0A165BX75_EXIGL|nr:hypothetical protein EXIGLDRAFT_731339 [Exidia glandulosa HHB12029]